jgi:uncharacterized protein YjiS (DUF1127 family)
MEHQEMSQSFVLQPRPAKSGAGIRLPMLLRWARAVEMWQMRRQGLRDLKLRDDRMLKDVGLSRKDGFWENPQAILRLNRPPWWVS